MSKPSWRKLAIGLVPIALVVASAVAPGSASAAKVSAPRWHWSKVEKLPGKAARIGLGGVACPKVNLCVADVPVSDGKTHSGIYYSTDPQGGASTWHYVAFSDFAGGGSGEDVSCDPTGRTSDCALVGYAPLPGEPEESYGGSIFQTGDPKAANWGAFLDDTDTNGDLGAVSCWVNVQCASLDDAGREVSTAGATVTGEASLFPADDGFSGIWSIGCAPFTRGQPNAFCAAVDQNSAHTIAWSTDPGSGTWTVRSMKVPGGALLWHIACGSAGLCIVAESNDVGTGHARLGVSHGDTAGKSWVTAFKTVELFPHDGNAGVSAVTCQSAKLCVAGGSSTKGGFVSVSTNPTKLTSWHTYLLAKGWSPEAVSCPSSKMCVLVASNGSVVVGTYR